jgi:hypothetical protein
MTPIRFSPSSRREGRWYEYLIRFAHSPNRRLKEPRANGRFIPHGSYATKGAKALTRSGSS